MTSHWNYTEKYENEVRTYDESIKRLTDTIERTQNILNNLDKPFNLLSQIEEKSEVVIDPSKYKGSELEYKYADQVENKIKAYFNIEQLRWSLFTKLALYTLIALSFLNMFARADFINLMLPLYMLVIFISGMTSNNIKSYLLMFLIANTFTLITDLLWLLFRDAVSYY